MNTTIADFKKGNGDTKFFSNTSKQQNMKHMKT